MKRSIALMLFGSALLCGCGDHSSTTDVDTQRLTVSSSDHGTTASGGGSGGAPAPGSPATPSNSGMDEVIATVSGEPISMRQLVDPLIESRGLTMLFNLAELELAKQNAARAEFHVVVTDKDIQDEHDRVVEKMFKDDAEDKKLTDALDDAITRKNKTDEAKLRGEIRLEREDYLTQLLVSKNIDRVEWDFGLKINTYLRKVLESQWKDKITDEQVQTAFGQMFGEKVKIKYILLQNMKEVIDAQRRLQMGDPFEDVARDMSHDTRTASLGGELPEFSRDVPEGKVPKAFIEAAFALRDGQISDPVAVGSSFMLIKRIKAIEPKAVKFDEAMKKSIRAKLYEELLDAGLKKMKLNLATEARKEVKITNPQLARQYKEMIDRQANAEKRANAELDLQQHSKDGLRHPDERPPATGPAGQAFTLPRLGPDTRPSVVPQVNK